MDKESYTRCNMPKPNRPLINTNNDDDHYETPVERKTKAGKSYDTLREYYSIPVGSTEVIQRDDGGPWTHGKIIDKGDHNHNDQSYKVYMKKIGWQITRNSKHVKVTPITSKQYHGNQLSKDRKTDTLENPERQFENQTGQHKEWT